MAAEPHASLLTLEEYLALEANSDVRHEFIDGHIYGMAGGTINHGLLSAGSISTLRGLLAGGPCRACPSDVRVRIAAHRYVYPDVSVTCDERDRGSLLEVSFPSVVVEVLSPTTEAYDRGEKFGLYRSCPSLEEYVLVNALRPEIEVYRRTGEIWALHTFGSNAEVELASLGIRFPVFDIYSGIDLTTGV